MFKLFALVFAAILAVAAAGVVSYSAPAVAYSGVGVAPVAYSAGVAPVAYSAGVAPVGYASPYVRSAYAAPLVHY